MEIGKLKQVPLRELWKHEERGFSAWLEKNLEQLSDTIGVHLAAVEREKRAGSFEVDLVAEDEAGDLVVIENQLEATNHDHLGKLLTYLTNLDAKSAVWITKDARPEHVKTVAWLNEATPRDVSFYLVRLSAYRIGESMPAPLFTVIVGPSEESKSIGRQKKDLAERHMVRLKFWDQLLNRAKEKGVAVHANRAPSKNNWLGAGAGRAGFSFVYVIWENEAAAELFIDTGDKANNERIFKRLESKKQQVEKVFGAPLLWEPLETRKACRIRAMVPIGGLKGDEQKWPAIQDGMIDAMGRLWKALKPYVDSLPE
ncbi:MAG: DUF4268 domain-containing protein [Candidatus Acidiferrales bacterium]